MLDIVGDTDDLFCDAADKRIYVSGGEGKITVIRQKSADIYEVAYQIGYRYRCKYLIIRAWNTDPLRSVTHCGKQEAEIRIFKVLLTK